MSDFYRLNTLNPSLNISITSDVLGMLSMQISPQGFSHQICHHVLSGTVLKMYRSIFVSMLSTPKILEIDVLASFVMHRILVICQVTLLDQHNIHPP